MGARPVTPSGAPTVAVLRADEGEALLGGASGP
jgi:hypothetical protein